VLDEEAIRGNTAEMHSIIDVLDADRQKRMQIVLLWSYPVKSRVKEVSLEQAIMSMGVRTWFDAWLEGRK
jgi:hypothetical protein